jgi:hypothetical protein
MEKTIDNLEEGDEIEWEDSDGETHTGIIEDLLEDSEWEVYVEYFRGYNADHTEVCLTSITKINGVEV